MWQKYTPWFIILLLLVILFTRKEEVKIIEIPAKSGHFEHKAPESVVRYDTIQKDGTIVYKSNPVNQNLLLEYTKLKDSTTRLEQYKEVIQEKTYKEIYRDSVQEIIITSQVIGTLKNQVVNYKIFPQTIEIKTKTPKYNVFLGTFITIPTTDNSTPSIGANIALKSPKTLYTLGYTNLKQIQAGIALKLF